MPTNIFNKNVRQNTNGFSVSNVRLNWEGTGINSAGTNTTPQGSYGLLVQRMQMQFSQEMTFVYDLTDPQAVYYVAGRSEGNATLEKVVGDNSAMGAFFAAYGDVCSLARPPIVISGTAGCARTQSTNFVSTALPSAQATTNKFKLHNPIIQVYGLSMQVEEGVIRDNVQLRFSDLELMA